MYETVLIRVARSVAKPNDRAVGPAHGLAKAPNDSVVIPVDRCGRSSVAIQTYEMRLRRSRVLAPY